MLWDATLGVCVDYRGAGFVGCCRSCGPCCAACAATEWEVSRAEQHEFLAMELPRWGCAESLGTELIVLALIGHAERAERIVEGDLLRDRLCEEQGPPHSFHGTGNHHIQQSCKANSDPRLLQYLFYSWADQRLSLRLRWSHDRPHVVS